VVVSRQNIGRSRAEHFNGEAANIGVLLGEPSGNLVDVDLDTTEARAVVPSYLPPTHAVFGLMYACTEVWLTG